MRVYPKGEIHTVWRGRIVAGSPGLDITFSDPTWARSPTRRPPNDCGVAILGKETDKFSHDHKGATLNAISSRHGIEAADIVVMRSGEKSGRWNASFDAG